METANTSGFWLTLSISWMDNREVAGDCIRDKINKSHMGKIWSIKESKYRTKDLHIPIDICFPHEGWHVHFHNIQNQSTSQLSGIFHSHIIEEAYCLSHQLQQFEAAWRTTIQNFCWKARNEQVNRDVTKPVWLIYRLTCPMWIKHMTGFQW